MAEEGLPLAEPLAKGGEADFLRAVAEAAPRVPMEAEVEGPTGAGRHGRTGERLTCRDGLRDRTPDTRPGPPRLRVPKLRQGSHCPPFLEPRRASGKAPVAVVQG